MTDLSVVLCLLTLVHFPVLDLLLTSSMLDSWRNCSSISPLRDGSYLHSPSSSFFYLCVEVASEDYVALVVPHSYMCFQVVVALLSVFSIVITSLGIHIFPLMLFILQYSRLMCCIFLFPFFLVLFCF